jgi:hypothetical protein
MMSSRIVLTWLSMLSCGRSHSNGEWRYSEVWNEHFPPETWLPGRMMPLKSFVQSMRPEFCRTNHGKPKTQTPDVFVSYRGVVEPNRISE